MRAHIDGVPWPEFGGQMISRGAAIPDRARLLEIASFPFDPPAGRTLENLHDHYLREIESGSDVHLMTFVDAAGWAEALDVTWSFGASGQYDGAVEWAKDWIGWANRNVTPIKEVRILAFRDCKWTPTDIVTLSPSGPTVKHVEEMQIS